MIRSLIVVGLAAMACACASDRRVVNNPPPLTPTEQFAIRVKQAPDEILLAPHPAGLSSAQADALNAVVQRWRDADSVAPITIRTPAGGQEDAYRSVANIEAALEGMGVGSNQIRVASYDAGGQPGAPIAVGFMGYQAEGPQCGVDWESFTASKKNRVNSNFGCATTANIAAMIANPADLLAPRQMDRSDALRREIVIDKYRLGVLTSSPADPQANGAVSTAVGQ